MSEPPLKKNKVNTESNYLQQTQGVNSLTPQEISPPQNILQMLAQSQLLEGNSCSDPETSEEFFDMNPKNHHRWSPEEFCSLLVCPKPEGFGWPFKNVQNLYHSMISGNYFESIESISKRIEAGSILIRSMAQKLEKSVRVKSISFIKRIEMRETVVSEDCSILEDDERVIISNNMVEMRRVVKKYVSQTLQGAPKKGLAFIKVFGNARTGKTTMAYMTLPFFIQQEFLKHSKFEKMNFRKFYYNCEVTKPSSLIESKGPKRMEVDEMFLRLFGLEDTHTFVIFDQVQMLSDEELIILKIMVTYLGSSKKITSIITGGSQAMLMKKMAKAGTNGVSFKECAINLCLQTAANRQAVNDTKKCYLTHFPSYHEVIQKLWSKENGKAIKRTFGFGHPAHLTQLLNLMYSSMPFEDTLFDLKQKVYEVYDRDYTNYLTNTENGKCLLLSTENLFDKEELQNFSDWQYFFEEDLVVKDKWKFRDTLFCEYLLENWVLEGDIVKRNKYKPDHIVRGHGKSSGPRCFISSISNSTAFEYLNDFHQVVGERMTQLKESLEIGRVPIVVISESLGSLITLHYETSYPNKHKIDGLTFISLPAVTSTQYGDDRSFDKAPGKILPPHKDIIMKMTLHYVPSYPARSLLPPLNYTCRVAKRVKKLTTDKLRYPGASIFAETQLYNLINSYILFSNFEEVHKSIRSDPRYSIKGVGNVELMVNPDMWTITTAKTVLDLMEKSNQAEVLANLKNPNILFLHGVYDYVTPIANLRRIEHLSKKNCQNCQRKVIDYDKSMLDLLNDMQAEKVKLDIENWLNQVLVR